MPRLSPYLFYDDLEAALGFLERAFGFEPLFTVPGPDGRAGHAQASYGDDVVMMGSTAAGSGLRPVKNPDAAGAVSVALYVYVEDVDRHFAHAKEAGAETLSEPEDMFWGDRVYCAVDPEGHFWTFATKVRDVSPEELQAGAGR